MDNYFRPFEQRKPPDPLPYSAWREALWQFLAVLNLVLGAWYISWRWMHSLNHAAMWFAVPLVLAETLAYVGLILFVINLWQDQPLVQIPPPAVVEDTDPPSAEKGRPIAVDVMFATYNEDPELVRLGIIDAKAITYPHPLNMRIHVLDDGRRSEMRIVCEEEGVNYISRNGKEGFKAGNLRNALEKTSGDFIVICDADTRPFSTILEHTLGHFRDPKVAWVQTPQWFYDIPEGEHLHQRLSRWFGAPGGWFGRFIEAVIGEVVFGRDPFVNDPQMFYDVILRRRNWANAAFCCGAGSIHRREAVMEVALRSFGASVERRVMAAEEEFTLITKEREVAPSLINAMRTEAVVAEVLTPYRFHVSEDIYSSIVLHSDRERGWKSVQHPTIESRMLSPHDMLSLTIQRFKYAGGSLDILFNDNPLFRKGLSLPQKLMYGSTFWSYLGSIWNLVFLIAPMVYLFTGLAPISAYSVSFFIHVFPFLVSLELAVMVGTWGIAGFASKASYLAFFPIGLKAIWTVLRGKKISFTVTPKQRQAGRHLNLVWPQIAVVLFTALSVVWAAISLNRGWGPHTMSGVVINTLWGLNNCLMMTGMIAAAFWTPITANKDETQ